MEQVFNEILSIILQIAILALIPFLFFLFRKQKKISFLQYIGLYKPTGRSILYAAFVVLFFVATGIGLALIDDNTKQMLLSPNTVTGKLHLMGLHASTLVLLLLIAIFKTSFAEEIFFRGFLGKRLINRFGFKKGNLLQALIFGIVHLLLFAALVNTSIFPLAFIFIFTTIAGWLIGFIKEKYANGSIVPGWMAHGLGNVLSYFLVAFVI